MTPEELAALHFASFQTPRPWSAKDFAGLLSMRENFIITGDGPSFIMGRTAAHEAELLTLAVHPEARGHGLGREMLHAYEEEAKSRLALVSFLEVAETNTVAISLYLSEGYSESGRRPRYYTTPSNEKIDALVLSKPLKHT
ncbi:GNAT family N-acetyltransferase [Celeribacter baekdonensis]|uniref:GNAT family N-acetyltransferase n=1 Tax=Celeribacter baekdonensis TaxID=875171 RepID=UPI0030D79406